MSSLKIRIQNGSNCPLMLKSPLHSITCGASCQKAANFRTINRLSRNDLKHRAAVLMAEHDHVLKLLFAVRLHVEDELSETSLTCQEGQMEQGG